MWVHEVVTKLEREVVLGRGWVSFVNTQPL
jgi:hypothetical protein